MAKKTLNLGAVLSDILKNSNSNFTELYDAIAKIQEKIADDGEKAVAYSTVDKMVTGLNAGNDEAGNALDITIGDEIYILDDATPDFWVSAVSSTTTTGTKPSTWDKGKNYTFGKYTIRVSKSREIELKDYQKIANLVTTVDENSADNKYPSAKAVYNAINALKIACETTYATKDEVRSAIDGVHTHANKALLDSYDQTNDNIKDAVSKKHSHSNKTILDDTTASYTTEEKEKLSGIANGANKYVHPAPLSDRLVGDLALGLKKVELDSSGHVVDFEDVTGEEVASLVPEVTTEKAGLMTPADKEKLNNIDDTLIGVTKDELGKVKDVKLNGVSVVSNGVASITIKDLASGYVEVKSDNTTVWTTQTVNGTTYQAIRFEKTDTALGVYNSAKQEIVVQKTYDDNYMYLCVGTSKINCFIRKLSGGEVGGGTGGNASGVGISSIEQTVKSSSDGGINVVTVTLTNGEKNTFQFKNGNKGRDGENGEPGLLIKALDVANVNNADVLLALFNADRPEELIEQPSAIWLHNFENSDYAGMGLDDLDVLVYLVATRGDPASHSSSVLKHEYIFSAYVPTYNWDTDSFNDFNVKLHINFDASHDIGGHLEIVGA